MAYKVVLRTKEGKLVSACVSISPCGLAYSKRAKTTALAGGILCFRLKKDAVGFIEEHKAGRNWELWKVKAEKKVRLPLYMLSWSELMRTPEELTPVWLGNSPPREPSLFHRTWPIGTVAYKHITLLSKIPLTKE